MKTLSLENELNSNAYPGRGIVIGRSADGKTAVTAYFIMGRSVNSRNRVFTETADGIKTEAADPSKLSDPHLIIYSPVRVLGNKTIVTNGDQTDTIYELMDKQQTFEQSLRTRESTRTTLPTSPPEFQVLCTLRTASTTMQCLSSSPQTATPIPARDLPLLTVHL